MNEIEARGKIKYRIANEMRKAGENKEEYEDLEIALQALKEIREYREIGTVEELKELKENKKEYYSDTDRPDGYGYTCTNKSCVERTRNNAIDEFAERLHRLCGIEIGDYQYTDLLDENRIDEIAEQMKGGAE